MEQKIKAREILEKMYGHEFTDLEFDGRWNDYQEEVLRNIPNRYKKVKSEDIPQEVMSVFPVVSNGKNGMYIWGAVGTGKTHSLYALKKLYGERCIRFSIRNISELLADIRSSFDEKSKMDILDNLYTGYDDLGAEKESDWVGEQIYRLVNEIYENKRAFVFTSNLSLGDLASRFGIQGDRIVSRIAEMANIIELKGNDRRV